MTDPLQVRAGERGVIRLFALDLPPEQVTFLREPGALAQVLGVQTLDETQADILKPEDLGEIGLSGYLVDGAGVPPSQIAPDAARLDARKGAVLVLRSRAFDGAATIAPAPGVRLIGTYGETLPDWGGAEPIATASAHPAPVSPRARRDRARRIGGSVFAVVMLALAAILLMVLL